MDPTIIETPLTKKLGFIPDESLAELAGMNQHVVDNMTAGEKVDLFLKVHYGINLKPYKY